jgi:uncharacterized protein YjbI with pentapeptide repeats
MESPLNNPTPSPSQKIDILSRTVVALVIGVVMGALLALVGLPAIQTYLSFVIIAFIVILILVTGIAFFIVQRKEWVLKKVFKVDDLDLADLKDAGQSLLKGVWQKDYDEARVHFDIIFTKLFAWYSWMNFRRWILTIVSGLFMSFGGILGTVLLYNQNKLLIQQNDLMQRQNYRLDQQTYLQEADRRSSLIFLMGNLLDAMDEELKADIGVSGVRDLSPQIVGRFIALSNSLRPYRYMESDTLVQRELSPERGQLLISLINSQIDNRTLSRIFQFADFSYADLSGAVLSREYLGRINLREANLSGADLSSCDLNQADLNKADLSGAILADANLQKANLSDTDLREAILDHTDTRGATLYGADLRGIDLEALDLRGAYLEKTQLDSAQVPNPIWLQNLLQLPADQAPRGKDLLQNYRLDSMLTSDSSKLYFLLRQQNEILKNKQ